jgi:pimeloyl-ACP methyl ester carboxylesterase
LYAPRFGDVEGKLTLCLPGLALWSRTYDRIGEGLAGPRTRIVAVDLRGRGSSEVTAQGTYGWVRHAREIASGYVGLTNARTSTAQARHRPHREEKVRCLVAVEIRVLFLEVKLRHAGDAAREAKQYAVSL